ncbi:MAG: hypothetical protein KGI67_02620 [Pseudomonadota bacterium]|nr:hypothetical protein [Pseudomonadota bacterium]
MLLILWLVCALSWQGLAAAVMPVTAGLAAAATKTALAAQPSCHATHADGVPATRGHPAPPGDDGCAACNACALATLPAVTQAWRAAVLPAVMAFPEPLDRYASVTLAAPERPPRLPLA